MKGKPEKEKTGSGDQQDHPGKIFSLPAITDKTPVIEKAVPDYEQGGKEVEETKACNKDVTVETNSRLLGFLQSDGENLVSSSVVCEHSTIIQPCFIGEDVILINATVGPNVSLGNGCHVQDSTIKNSLIQSHSHIKNADLDNAMIGSHASFNGNFTSISIGDYSVLE